MTATRDRRSDPEVGAEPAWDDRPIIGQFRGLPWWGAVLLAFGLTAIAAFIDMKQQDSLGRIYQGAFIVGCVGAICLVRRKSLFGPMVQPPLIFAITAVGAVALLSQKEIGPGLKSLVFSVALPLTSNFPTMGITTGGVVAIGLFRWWRERDPDPQVRPNKVPKQRGVDIGFDDEPGQGIGGRGERGAKPARRGRPEMEELPPTDDRAPRRVPGRAPRPSRDAAAGREGGRDAGGTRVGGSRAPGDRNVAGASRPRTRVGEVVSEAVTRRRVGVNRVPTVAGHVTSVAAATVAGTAARVVAGRQGARVVVRRRTDALTRHHVCGAVTATAA